MKEKQFCIAFRYNHFDPLWRRRWDRDFQLDGKRYVSYRSIEETWINEAIASCSDGVSCFMIESAWVLRHYIEKHPEQIETFKQLSEEGRFELLGSGENIVDSNLIHGELLVRNLILGTFWAEKILGARPTIGWYFDGFGSCAQMPQIFRQCGYKWVPAISYSVPDAPYWKGLDGSVVLFEIKQKFKQIIATNSPIFYKHTPCAACKGKGCEICSNRGFTEGKRAEFDGIPEERFDADIGVLLLTGEELLPGKNVADAIEKYNIESSYFIVEQGIYRDLKKYLKDELACIDNPPMNLVSTKIENNPVHTGCYVTRIKMKQKHREVENLLMTAEKLNTLLKGSFADELRNAWRLMTLSGFHDAITSTHIDMVYEDLFELLDSVKDKAVHIGKSLTTQLLGNTETESTIFNCQAFRATAPINVVIPNCWKGVSASIDRNELPVYEVETLGEKRSVSFLAKDIPALGAVTVVLKEAPAKAGKISGNVVSCGDFTVKFDSQGITNIRTGNIGDVINTKEFLFGELILEHDFGDPWATRSLDMKRERLSNYTQLIGAEVQNDSIIIKYKGQHPSNLDQIICADPMVSLLEWEQTFFLRKGLPWIEIKTDVDWYTHSRRLRLAFPSTTDSDRGIYEIPYGILERDRYEQVNNHGGNAGGDWPAINWAGIQTPGYIFAVFNKGTPSYRVENGVVFTSILRSPQLPYFLFEPQHYNTYNYNGMLDHGKHTFTHALYIGKGPWYDSDVVKQASIFNSGFFIQQGALLDSMPEWDFQSKNTMITAIKFSEDRDDLIIRLVEYSGIHETVKLRISGDYKFGFEANLLEEVIKPLKKEDGYFIVEMSPWKIVTLRITYKQP